VRVISRRGLFHTSVAAVVGTALGGCRANSGGSAGDRVPVAGATPAQASSSASPLPPPALVHSNGSITSKTAPRIVWSYDPHDSVTSVWYGQGQVLLTRRQSLVSLDAATGQPIWQQIPWFGMDAPQAGAVVGHTLYLAGTAAGKGQGLLTIDIATGHLDLAYAVPYGTGMGAVTGPHHGVVYAIVHTGATGIEIWAIDTSTWKVRWKSAANNRFTDQYIHVSANGSHVVYGGVENSLSVYRVADGALAWSTQPNDACCFNMQGPIGDAIIGYSRTAVFGLDLATGAKLWQAAMPKPAPPSRSPSQPQTTRLPLVFAEGADAYYIWDGTHMTAYRAGEKAEALWTSTLRPDLQLLDELTVTFDGNDTMFIAGHGIFAADTRTGGCRWEFTQPYVDLNLAGAAAGVGTYYIAAPTDGSNLEEKVFALAVD
jgi:hypothetical protein